MSVKTLLSVQNVLNVEASALTGLATTSVSVRLVEPVFVSFYSQSLRKYDERLTSDIHG